MKFLKHIKRDIPIIIFAAILVLLITITAISISGYSSNLEQKYRMVANNITEVQASVLENAINQIQNKASAVAGAIPIEIEPAREYMVKNIYFSDLNIEEIRYFIGDTEYDHKGNIYNGETNELLLMAKSNESSVSGQIYDRDIEKNIIAVFIPLEEHENIDSVLIFFNIVELKEKLETMVGDTHDATVFRGLCTGDGTIVFELFRDNFNLQQNENLFQSVRSLTNDKSIADNIEKESKKSGVKSFETNISGEKYITSLAIPEKTLNRWFMVEIYNYDGLISGEKDIIMTFGSLIALVVLLLLAFLVYIIYFKMKTRRFLTEYDTIDPLIGCPTIKSFAQETEIIINRNKVTKFVVIYLKIERFEYIQETFGEAATDDSLRFVSKVIKRNLKNQEFHAYMDIGQFAILMHYQDMESLSSRLKVISAIISNYPPFKEQSYILKTGYGIYELDRSKEYSVLKMVDRAALTKKSYGTGINGDISIYDEAIETRIQHEAQFEAKMYNSLKEGEFVNFYQPKYNINQNRLDGCEALVRWYEPETGRYKEPSEFLPFFEANGSINDLDRYVFEEACKFISSNAESGQKMVPISVNVSRVTATQDGFVDYYINTKRKYNIADKFLTLEFTESFAFENYIALKGIVSKLQENGFLCSLDDFGSGYSSYNILKDLKIDELKLDKFFLLSGISSERDDLLLKSVIDLAKAMRMKVTQEGVETKEDLERLKKLGCDIIQGYYYSRPLKSDDYIKFIQSSSKLWS